MQNGRYTIWRKKDTGNIHITPYAISVSSWVIFLQFTPYTKCSRTTPCSPNVPTYPSYGYLMIVWENHGREDKGREKRQMKRTKEMEWMVVTCIPTYRSARESFNSQQHVLLVLLKDRADVLEDVWVKEVYTAVYDVTHKCARLFYIMQDLRKRGTVMISRWNSDCWLFREIRWEGLNTSFVSSFSTIQP